MHIIHLKLNCLFYIILKKISPLKQHIFEQIFELIIKFFLWN